MFGTKTLENLRLRKQALTLESDLNRLSLRATSGQVRQVTGWMTQTARVLHHRKAVVLGLATIGGMLLARRRRGSSAKPTGSHSNAGTWLGLLLDLLRVFIRV